ncbi:uncharacterized protein [Henckelia pumila]|uniref:uncharacterized protein n=1 Tax=Henckelia pumila TaxID=405737 RepID=UPI003C6E4C87
MAEVNSSINTSPKTWARRARTLSSPKGMEIHESKNIMSQKRDASTSFEEFDPEIVRPGKKQNVRGLGNQRAFRELKRLIAEKKPSLLFLCETQKRDIDSSHWSYLLGYKGCFVVNSRGRSGGLCLLWKDPFEVSIKSFSQGHIDCLVKHGDNPWRFTGFYGNPATSLRHSSWELLRRLADLIEFRNISWIVGGDFNEIWYDSEKIGGNRRNSTQTTAFRDSLDMCSLQSFHCQGDMFTWVNCRHLGGLIFARLDRFVGNFGWRMLYPTARSSALDFYHSDHRPIYLDLGSSSSLEKWQCSNRVIRFESFWSRGSECEGVIAEAWQSFNCELDFMAKLQLCSSTLQQWALRKFKSIPRQLKKKQTKLASLRTHERWNNDMDYIKELEIEIEDLSSQEEMYWRQRSRVDWLTLGDKNTKFFHKTTTI